MRPRELATFDVAPELGEVERLGCALQEAWQQEGLPEEHEPMVSLALEEMLSNVIRHGNAKQIQVDFLIAPDEFVIEIADSGSPYDPTTTPPFDNGTPLEGRRAGGLGVHLTRQIMERFEYERAGDRNLLRLGKRLRGETSEA